MYAIETFNLTKEYQPPSGLMRLLSKSPIENTIRAVDNVSLKIKQGELFGLIGPNGAGKTTLIKMLCTLLWPTSGTALVGGHDLIKEEEQAKASIGYVPSEERSFYWRLTGRQNLQFFAALYNIPLKERERRIDQVLEQVGLSSVANNMLYSYSTGMKQKLLIARGLFMRPSVLFLDEPTRGVDTMTAKELKEFIREKLVNDENKTVLLTTHRLEDIEQLCDRLAIMHRGRIIFCGTKEELQHGLKRPDAYSMEIKGLSGQVFERIGLAHKLAALTVNNNETGDTLAVSFAFSNGTNSLSTIINDVFSAGGELLSCTKKHLGLEEIFSDLVRETDNEPPKDPGFSAAGLQNRI